ncbi:hypothetical protein Hanom_Chr09g00824931 [Helianthus anomalus]
MSKMDPVPVPNRYRTGTGTEFTEPGTYSVPIRYPLLTFSVPVRYRSGTVPVRTGILLVFTLKYRYRTGTGTEPYRTGYIRYRYRYPLLRIFGTGSFGTGTGSVPNRTELIPSIMYINI